MAGVQQHSSGKGHKRRMNLDLVQARNHAGLVVQSKEAQQSQLTYIMNKQETANITRDISTKLYNVQAKSRDVSPAIVTSPKITNIQSIKIQTSQSPAKNKRLEAMLAAMIPEDPTNSQNIQTVIDQRKASQVMTSSVNEKSSIYRDDIQQQQLLYEPAKPIEMKIRNTKKSVQHDSSRINKLLALPSQQFGNQQQHQKSQNIRVMSGSGEIPQTLNPVQYSQHQSHTNSNMVNIQVPLQINGQQSAQGSVTKTQYLQQRTYKQSVSTSKNNSLASPIQQQQLSPQSMNIQDRQMPGTTKVQNQLLLRNNNIMSSAKALYNAAKIQRIQIVNKPNRNPDSNKLAGADPDLQGNVINQQMYEVASQYNRPQQRQTYPGQQIGKLVGANSQHYVADGKNRDKKLYSLSSGKRSTPHATSTEISRIDGHVSSYLHPQKFSIDAKHIMKQIQNSATNIDGGSQPITNSGIITHKRQARSPPDDANATNSNMTKPLMKNANTSAMQNAAIQKSQSRPKVNELGHADRSQMSPIGGGPVVNNDGGIVMPIDERGAGLEVVSKQIQQKSTMKDISAIMSDRSEKDFDANKMSFSMSPQKKSFLKSPKIGVTVQHHNKTSYNKRIKRDLASILEPLISSEDSDGPREDFLQMQQSFSSQPKTVRNGQQSVPTRLPKLQFVVKYANRSRHDSTVQHSGMDLQGSRTHIMPLNLLHQNSLYFVEDPQFAKAYATQQEILNATAQGHTTTSNQEIKLPSSSAGGMDKTMTTGVGGRTALFETENLGEDQSFRLSSPQQLKSTSDQEMLNLLTRNQQKLQQTQQIKSPAADNGDPKQKQLYPFDAEQSSMAWIRKARRTLGYVRTFKNRPFKMPQIDELHKTTRDGSLVSPIRKDPVSSWDNLQNKFMMEKQQPGMTEEDLAGLEERQQKFMATVTAQEPVASETCPSEFPQHTNDNGDSRGINNPESCIPPNSESRGRVSSAGDYQSYLLQPKIVPSTSSNPRQHQANLNLTQPDFAGIGSAGRPNQNKLQPSSSKDLQSAQDEFGGNNNEQTILQIPGPPRTSQLEKRHNLIMQEPSYHETQEILMTNPRTTQTRNTEGNKEEDSLKDNEVGVTGTPKHHQQITMNNTTSLEGANFGFLIDAQTFQGGSFANSTKHQNSPTTSGGSHDQDKVCKEMIIGAIVNSSQSNQKRLSNPYLKKDQLHNTQRGSGSIFRIEAPGRRNNVNARASLVQTTSALPHAQRESSQKAAKEFVIDKTQQTSADRKARASKKSKQTKTVQKGDKQKRAPLAQSEFSKEGDDLSSSAGQYSKVILDDEQEETSKQTTIDRVGNNSPRSPQGKDKDKMPATIGQFRGLNNLLGLLPQSKQSEMTRSRIQMLIQRGQSPFRTDDAPKEIKESNTDLGTLLKQDQSTDMGNLKSFNDAAQVPFSGSWQSKVLKADLRKTNDSAEISSKTKKFNGVQVMRNGDVSPKSGADAFMIANNLVSSSETLAEDPAKYAQEQRSIVSKMITAPLSHDQQVLIEYDNDDQQKTQEGQVQEQKFVVQVKSTTDKKKQIKEVASLKKLQGEDQNVRTPVDEEPSSKEDAEDRSEHESSSSEDVASEEEDEATDSKQSKRSKMKMTQATGSQFELEDFPNLQAITDQAKQMLDSEANSVEQYNLNTNPNMSSLPSSQAQVSWRLNNDSVQNDDDKRRDLMSHEQAAAKVSRSRDKSVSKGSSIRTTEEKKIQTIKVRPGINKILPKQLMQELVESQGRRQMQEWLKLDQASHDSLAQKNNRASTSPTREYLQRKFNSSKRKKEVNFFKQAHKMQIQQNQTPYLVQYAQQPLDHSYNYARPASEDDHQQTQVLNYEDASKSYNLQGVNVLTGSSVRPSRISSHNQ